MKKFILSAGMLTSAVVHSQVGIDTEAPKATLQVMAKASDASKADGIIAPRLTGSELKAKDAAYGTNQNAALVYVTSPLDSSEVSTKTTNVTSAGYFYFDGNIWQKLSTESTGNNWSILGNSGTLSGTNFIGTTDASDFVVKTDNTERERTYNSPNNQNFIKKITGGDLSINGITVGRGSGNKNSNATVGYQSLNTNDTGGNNVAMGSFALYNNTKGFSNVAIGHSSMTGNTEGGSNVAIGQSTLPFNTTGELNIAIGHSALSNPLNKTGRHNIGIGFTAAGNLEDATSNNIAIGAFQGLANRTGSNQLNIGGAIFGTGLTGTQAAPAGNIGIGTTTPSTRLEVNNGTTNGAIKIVDGTQGAGKVLTSDADGLAMWQTPTTGTSTEPWNISQTTNPATDNTQNIYQTGSVAIGKNGAANDVSLDVEGAIRTGTYTSTIPVGAVGTNSAAFGLENQSQGANAMSWGEKNQARGDHSTTGGLTNIATGARATAFGERNTASGNYSLAVGLNNTASGLAGIALGKNNTPSGTYSTSIGGYNTSDGNFSVVLGSDNIASTRNETIIGNAAAITTGSTTNSYKDWVLTDPLFQIGNGVPYTGTTPPPNSRSNAMTVLKNGNIGIGEIAPTTKLEVNNGTTNGAIKIVDGTQGEGKILTSDANGVGTWRSTATSKTTALGVFPSADITTRSDLQSLNTTGTDPSDPQKYTGVYIDLEPGKWVVNSGMTIYCFKADLTHFQHAYLSNSQTAVVQNDFQNLGPGANAAFAGKISNGSVEGIDADPQRNANFLTGSSVINVTKATRIYLLLENKPDLYWSYSTSAWENYFYALPINN